MKVLFNICFLLIGVPALSQDTFSIVAVDSITGEVGSAGASCVTSSLTYPQGVRVICDVIPGIGAINTQSVYNSSNKMNAHIRMVAGDSAQAIIDWLTVNDAQNNPAVRQYGVVELNNGHPRSAAFTGAGCNDYKNHITGPGYSIQGNILLGQQVLDSMEWMYLNTTGTLADKLMAALQGANMVGADSRCAQLGLSSLSSYIRVAKPSDTTGTYSTDLYMSYPVNSTWPVDPIDSLQTLYNNWLVNIDENKFESGNVTVLQNDIEFVFELRKEIQGEKLIKFYDTVGRLVYEQKFSSNRINIQKSDLRSEGVISYLLLKNGNVFDKGTLMNVRAVR